MLEHLRRERHDLHVLPLAQLSGHGPEDTGRLRLPLVIDDDRGVLVEPDVAPVLAAGLLHGADDDRLGHVSLLHLPRRDRVLDGDDDLVAQAGIPALAAAEHADHERPPGAGIIRDLEDRFLLDHGSAPLLRAFEDLDHTPPDRLRQGPGLHDPHGIAALGAVVIPRLDRLGAGHLLAVDRVREPARQAHGHGLLHLVADHDTGTGLPPGPIGRLDLAHRHPSQAWPAIVRARSSVSTRAMSRRTVRKRIGLSIASVADRNFSLKRSSRSSTSLDFSSSAESAVRSRARISVLPLHEPGEHRELRGGELERLPRQRLLDAFDLEQHAAGLHHRHPPFRVALALTHAGLGRLLGDRLVREDPDPHLAATLHLTRHRDTRRLDLPAADPARIQAHQGELAEGHGVAAGRVTLVAPLERLAELDSLGCQHGSIPRAVGPAADIFGDLALEDPDLDPDGAVGRLRRAVRVVDVGAEGVERHAPLTIPLGPRDLRPAEAARDPHADPLRAHPHRALHRALHGAAEADALLELPGDVVRHQLRRELGPLDLLDVDRRLLGGQLRQLVAELVHLGAALADHHARSPGVDRHGHLARLPLDLDLRDRRMAETGHEVLADELILLEEGRHVLRREPARRPGLDDPEAEADRMRLLTHYLPPRAATISSMWLVRFRIGVARPCAAAVNRLSGCPMLTMAVLT